MQLQKYEKNKAWVLQMKRPKTMKLMNSNAFVLIFLFFLFNKWINDTCRETILCYKIMMEKPPVNGDIVLIPPHIALFQL